MVATNKNPRGAGRKPTGNAKKLLSVRIEKDIFDYLKGQSNNISTLINDSLRRDLKL